MQADPPALPNLEAPESVYQISLLWRAWGAPSDRANAAKMLRRVTPEQHPPQLCVATARSRARSSATRKRRHYFRNIAGRCEREAGRSNRHEGIAGIGAGGASLARFPQDRHPGDTLSPRRGPPAPAANTGAATVGKGAASSGFSQITSTPGKPTPACRFQREFGLQRLSLTKRRAVSSAQSYSGSIPASLIIALHLTSSDCTKSGNWS